MNLPGPRLAQFHLQPGELIVTQEALWVVTVLGSCVAVTMFNPRFRLAAMCHALLAEPGPGGLRPGSKESQRYLSHVIPAMAARFFQLGLRPGEVEVKMFGGGNVIDLGGDLPHDRSIGDANVSIARILVESAGFQIKGGSVGGDRGCKIVFNTGSGQVLHKHLSRRGART